MTEINTIIEDVWAALQQGKRVSLNDCNSDRYALVVNDRLIDYVNEEGRGVLMEVFTSNVGATLYEVILTAPIVSIVMHAVANGLECLLFAEARPDYYNLVVNSGDPVYLTPPQVAELFNNFTVTAEVKGNKLVWSLKFDCRASELKTLGTLYEAAIRARDVLAYVIRHITEGDFAGKVPQPFLLAEHISWLMDDLYTAIDDLTDAQFSRPIDTIELPIPRLTESEVISYLRELATRAFDSINALLTQIDVLE